jgi:hypothetical protein
MVPLLKGLSKICPRKMSPVSMSVGFPVWTAVMHVIFLKVIGLWVWTVARPTRPERENSELRTNRKWSWAWSRKFNTKKPHLHRLPTDEFVCSLEPQHFLRTQYGLSCGP